MRILTYYGDSNLTVPFGSSLEATLDKELKPGTVVDVSKEGTLARAWVTEVAHYSGHDIAWPHDVSEFDRQELIDTGEAYPLKVWQFHVYLAVGNGIPPAPAAE
jgi:hypothetical protein